MDFVTVSTGLISPYWMGLPIRYIHLQETLSLLEFKCWYYSKAMEDGTEEYLQAMLPDKLPSDIQKLYDASHK